ncbi:hypothetical protein FBU30_004929 [Linnemannia zychae]|nr:hypothetical protein FBU30_004929 [Linnemannia zychae]
MSMNEKPTVLIAGGGLGGLVLGALLEKSGVPYTIFERVEEPKSSGSVMGFGPALLPLFQQLGIYDEFLKVGKHFTFVKTFDQNLVSLKPMDWRPVEDSGYKQYTVARPELYGIFLRQIPSHMIHFGHRVLNISERDDKVTVHLSNNNTFEGDIIVGADGTYSAVRQRMYEKLAAEGRLPANDYEELPFDQTCLIGQTKALDPE